MTAALTGTPPFTVTAARDYDPEVGALPGMSLGRYEIDLPGGEAARRLFAAGARHVTLPRPVDVTDTADAAWTVRALSFVGDLTSLAIAVDWQLHTGPDPDAWRHYGHLHPPTAVLGTPDPAATALEWRNTYYICKCVFRHGPGFIQVRDRRYGELRRFTIDEPEYHAAIEALTDGARADAVPGPVLDDLMGETLVLRFGDHVWWAPYRVRRWSEAPMVI
ncbi:DUF5825 family protein [Streptomyces lavendulae]|uniref:Uncharacterized protein n=1 Tax=Streptomyces lavendulae subsp. lavendulae TaxID=58340 RepID=A0A2K8PTV0_STRLA|nr:DUF5825 family protein [Streptomyces lavendulae]ATZ29263.1 hypothetical protein SLAV_37490 [Streptomyces lavendulae subsp. lavendulae]QUQ59079.1 hypothetical protein SLLC_35650 [Streptomyces lavendulae subsp. lavendulae]